MTLDMIKLKTIEGFAMRGQNMGMFHWCNESVTAINRHIITDEMDVEPVFQQLKFHKGNKKMFDKLYQEILEK